VRGFQLMQNFMKNYTSIQNVVVTTWQYLNLKVLVKPETRIIIMNIILSLSQNIFINFIYGQKYIYTYRFFKDFK
jgi:hypothetical protein